VITLQTERLLLRMFREDDLEPYATMCADPEVMRYIGTGITQTRSEAWRAMASFLGHWALRGYGMWAVERKDTGELVGRVGFIEPEGWPGFELGWLLGRPYWGQGYAREAATEALRFGRHTLGRDRAISLIRPENKRSIDLAVALGYKFSRELDFLGGPTKVYEIVMPG